MALAILLMTSLVACAAPSVGEYPDDLKLPKRSSKSTDKDDDDDKDSTTTKPGSSTSGGTTTTPGGSTPTTPTTLALTVNQTGSGEGSITSQPAGVTCTGKTCAGNFASGTSVTLTPTPVAGSLFAGWTGGCTGTGPCVTTVAGATTVGAKFESIAGTWTGTYTNNRTAFNCNFQNAGSMNSTLTASGMSFTTATQVTGLEIRNTNNCGLVDTRNGSSQPSAATVSGNKVTGNWVLAIDGIQGTLDMPFTATIENGKMTGTWTCTGCTGGFTLTK